MLKSIITTLVMLLLPFAAAAELPLAERSVVVLFGDSITVGENSRFGGPDPMGSTSRGCPTIYLNAIFNNESVRPASGSCETEGLNAPVYTANNEVRNAIVASWGVGGSTTSSGSSRITSNLNTTTAQLQGANRIVLILYGTNDINSGISSVTTRNNIVSMIDKSRSAGYTPIVGLLTPRDDIFSSVQARNTQIAIGANSRGEAIVDHFSSFNNIPGGYTTLLDQEQFPSGLIRLHPNNQGYLLIAENWFDQQLKNLIPAIVPDVEEDFAVIMAPIISLLLDD